MDEAASSGTVTQRLQADVENAVASLHEAFGAATIKERSLMLTLHRDDHEEYVVRGLRRLSAAYHVLDSSRPWLCYWILHSLALLGRAVDEDLYVRTVDFLLHCQDPKGGYAGGPGQMCRKKILEFLLRMKDPCGGFRVHDDGEMDMRGCYTALAVAHLLDIMVPELLANVGEHVRSCQTYEGGIGAEPGAEAHGGYTFCGLAALALNNQLHVLDLPSLVNWVAFRQGRVEGGFQGRTNKLVDGCYSFWQGGCFQLLQQHMPELLAQQTMSAAALHTPRDEGKSTSYGPSNTNNPEVKSTNYGRSNTKDPEVKSTNYGPLDTKDSEQHVAAEFQGESASDVLDDFQGDKPKLAEDGLSCPDDSMDEKDEASQAMSPRPSSQTSKEKVNLVVTAEVEASKEFHSPTKGIPAKEWHSDEDEDEYWDLDRKPGHNTAEKLFPMPEAVCQRVPSHNKVVEVVDLADDWQGESGGISGSTSNSTGPTIDVGSWDDILCGSIFNSNALQAYILLCCQDLDGGLRDKPGKPCDHYHTCYCLSGLAAAQYSTAHRIGAPPPPSGVLGPYSNLLEATHALCNVRLDRYYESQSYFKRNKEVLDV